MHNFGVFAIGFVVGILFKIGIDEILYNIRKYLATRRFIEYLFDDEYRKLVKQSMAKMDDDDCEWIFGGFVIDNARQIITEFENTYLNEEK